VKIAFVTDAYDPYISGVVNTAKTTARYVKALGHEIDMIVPPDFRPTIKHSEVELVPFAAVQMRKRLEQKTFDAIHIATEGPLGWAALRYCETHHLSFTTSYCTQWPQYFKRRYGVPLALSWAVVRAFHAEAKAVMVPSEVQQQDLLTHGFNQVVIHGRGVDTEQFFPNPDYAKIGYEGLARPIWLSVGRVSAEKGIEEMLLADVPGTKIVIGDGPARSELQKKFPQAHFVGVKRGEELRAAYAGADYFCFPSRTDTFGQVNTEALACGLPVVTHDQMPNLLIRHSPTSVVAKSFQEAMIQAAQRYASPAKRADPALCVALARDNFSWEAATRQFISHLVPARHVL
jgi:glycosyltransferase involved in cell wall biosynthesis